MIKVSEVQSRSVYVQIQVFMTCPPPEMSALPRLSWWVDLLGECNLLGSVSSQQRFEATNVKALGALQLSVCVIVLGQISFI